MALVKCNECGKEMSDKAKICPKCGCPNYENVDTISSDKSDTLCLTGLIVGIVSFFIDFVGLVSATGLTLSIIGYTKATNSKSKKFAIIGIICSAIELILKFIQLTILISNGY